MSTKPECTAEQKQTLRQMAIAAIHRDKTLSPAEKQQRIQAILRGDAENSEQKVKDEEEVAVAAAAATQVPKEVSYYSGNDSLAQTTMATAAQNSNEFRVFGCAHFKRDLYLLAPCCNKWYVCRICHDENEDHQMNHSDVQRQCCMFCLKETPVDAYCKSEICVDRRLAAYYCEKCHIHRKETDIMFWHCDKCKMCRVGSAKTSHFHCDQCNLCYSSEAKETHICLRSPSETQSCPICSQVIQTSHKPVVALRCGHAIHVECLQNLFSQRDVRAMRCPICKLSFDNMQHIWSDMDLAIATTIMPEPERYWTAHIGCNDCQKHTPAAPFHYCPLSICPYC